jgi:hypothetical protein
MGMLRITFCITPDRGSGGRCGASLAACSPITGRCAFRRSVALCVQKKGEGGFEPDTSPAPRLEAQVGAYFVKGVICRRSKLSLLPSEAPVGHLASQ